METAIAAFVRPFALLLLLILVVHPIAWAINVLWRDCALKRHLYDSTLMSRRPAIWMVWWFAVVIVFMVLPAFLSYKLYS